MKKTLITCMMLLGMIHSMVAQTPYLVKDIFPGSASSNPRNFTTFNGALYFIDENFFMWKTDGTEAGTVKVSDQLVYSTDYYPGTGAMFQFNNYLYFMSLDQNQRTQLFRTDGTTAGTQLLATINPSNNGSSVAANFTVLNNELYFGMNTGLNPQNYELWKTDGTDMGTVLVKDFNPGPPSGFYAMNAIGNELYIDANDGIHGYEVWKSDGTTAGTFLLKDINPNSTNGFPGPGDFFEFQSKVFFIANDGVNGLELWQTDGTDVGTTLFKDLNPGIESSFAGRFTILNQKIVFSARTANEGTELWVSDGTVAGTTILKDIISGPTGSLGVESCVLNNILYFSVINQNSQIELWKTDGTNQGTVFVKDIGPSTGSNNYMFTVNGRFYFYANDLTNGFELWTSDGTANGTFLVADINPGASNSSIEDNDPYFGSLNNKLFFKASEGVNGHELWAVATNVGLEELEEVEDVLFYPNPTNSTFQLQLSANESLESVSCFDAAGNLMRFWINPTTNEFELADLRAGIYYITYKSNQGIKWAKLTKI